MAESFPVISGTVPPPSSYHHNSHNQNNTNLNTSLVPTASHSTANLSPLQTPLNGRRRKEHVKTAQPLALERVLGLTTVSNSALALTDDLVAYAAGAVVVLYNHKRNKQVGFLYPPHTTVSTPATAASANNTTATNGQKGLTISPLGGQADLALAAPTNPRETKDDKKTSAGARVKPISCLAFSPDGNFLAAGEMGHQPRILIWNVKERTLLHELRGHKFGVLALSFSPNLRYLVSVGFQHDGYLFVWNWKKGVRLAGNKVTSKVNALHAKFWHFDARGRIPKRGNLASRETQVLDGRTVVLGTLRDSNFVDVKCDPNNSEDVYFVTDNGILSLFKKGRAIEKWVNLQAHAAFSIAVSAKYVVCACSEGTIRLFEPGTLQYRGILPKPHPLGMDISAISSPDMIASMGTNLHYPDVVSLAYDGRTDRVTAVYSDRSMFLWDIRDMKRIGKYRSFIYHSDCIWGIEPCPTYHDNENETPSSSALPANSFATCSADGTVRFWNLETGPHATQSTSPLSPDRPTPNAPSPVSTTSIHTHRRNIYSRELFKMLYVDDEAVKFLKSGRAIGLPEDQHPDFGIRSVKISKDAKFIATGDRSGNLRIHDMETWEQKTYQEAHDSEILAMDFTHPQAEGDPFYIATASRDRLLHVFDIQSDFRLVQTLDDHSSSITAVKFSKGAKRILSCGADKGIIFRSLDTLDTPRYITYHNYSGRSTVFDMSLDSLSERYIATVTGERRLIIFNTDNGKPVKACIPETAEEAASTLNENSGGSLINIDLDPFSGTFAVTSGSDRCLRLFDLTNGICIARACAHAELITAVKFLRTSYDALRVVSTCSDGTIFVWKVAQSIYGKMKARSMDRDNKAQNMVLHGGLHRQSSQDDLAEEKRGGNLLRELVANADTRLRRVSIANAVKPTPSISQMARQGQRKTFSAVSPAERKYDDLYKLARERNAQQVAQQVQAQAQAQAQAGGGIGTQESQPAPPPSRAPAARMAGPRERTGRRTPEEESKLERLYVGLPISGPRTGARARADMPRRSPTGNHQHALRRQKSRDALNAEQRVRLTRSHGGGMATGQSSKEQQPPVPPQPRRNSEPELEKKKIRVEETSRPREISRSPEMRETPHSPETQAQDPMLESDSDKSQHDLNNAEEDDECDGGGTENDGREEEGPEEEEEEEEEVIFMATTEQEDKVATPVEVKVSPCEASISSEGHSGEESSGSPTVSDNEREEEDSDEGDNNLIASISSHTTPRLSPSRSQVTSMHMSRSSSVQDPIPQSPSPVDLQQERQEKLQKRQSFSTRYLSALDPSRPSRSRPATPGALAEAIEAHQKAMTASPDIMLPVAPIQRIATTDPSSTAATVDSQTCLDKINTEETPVKNKSDKNEMAQEANVKMEQIKDDDTKQITALGEPLSGCLNMSEQGQPEQKETPKPSRTPIPLASSSSPPPTPPSNTINEPAGDSTDYESLQADLDGAILLLNGVIEALRAAQQSSDDHASAFAAHTRPKMEQIAHQIEEVLGLKTTQEDPATLALLERYSNSLLQLVAKKL
ncbi:hypothetical protein BCR43DRAFT_481844 [Syncephalastrum racemosum]|uniref:MABP1/WDR62 second WD40 domain-containing protein n=1 Tax=Syncephalastrum racemosum TaxID=13706 RepID=A0A1X2HSW3_SYNRA|nr:hypothetical protein BCR43DRAFT_481844 [Syncephalastrum racemosum]